MFLLPTLTLFAIYYLYQHKNKNAFGIISYLIIVYIIMGLSSIAIYFSGIYLSIFYYSLEAMAYMSLCFMIIFFGFFSFEENKINSLELSNIHLYKFLETTLIVGGISAILFFMPFAISGLTGDVSMNRYNVTTFPRIELSAYGIINSVLSLISNLFILSLVFAFVNFARGHMYQRRAYLLLLSSFSYVIYVLAYVGRDGVVYWIMSFLFVFLLMRGFLNTLVARKIKRLSFFIFIILLIPFFIISIARFSPSGNGIAWELLNYIGQQVKNFNDTYQVKAPLGYGRAIFPVFLNFIENIGFDVPNSKNKFDYQTYYLNQGVTPTTFKTYFGELLMDFGRIGTIVIISITSLITRRIIKTINRFRSLSISNLILLILLYQIVLWGVFYFRLYSANYYIITIILLFILFKFSYNKRLNFKLFKINNF